MREAVNDYPWRAKGWLPCSRTALSRRPRGRSATRRTSQSRSKDSLRQGDYHNLVATGKDDGMV